MPRQLPGMGLAFRVGDAEVEGKKLHFGVLELENAVLALLWEGLEPKLGSTSITLPGMASSQVLGDRDQLIGRTLGTYIASKYGKISLVSTYLSQGYSEVIGKAILDLVKRTTEEKG